MPELGLRVDVCNRRALEEGVPAVLALLADAGVRATFFVTFGPDRSGLALGRIFQPGFLAKMLRTRALRLYGFKTLLYGTLLPAPLVGEAFPERLRAIAAAGHEVGVHGWDHAGWQRDVERLSTGELERRQEQAAGAFADVLGHRPLASAAPGWRCSPQSLRVSAQLGLRYASDCRGAQPFYPRVDGETLDLLQVPTTLPTSDELIGHVAPERLAAHYLERIAPARREVLAVHAEAEGLLYAAWLRTFLARAPGAGIRICTLAEIAEQCRAHAEARDVVQRTLPGRAGTVACSLD